MMTSPNIPTPDSATLYTGTILVANSNLSEGLGTTRPFELVVPVD
ncbi:exo-beta-N-acetylmuramidase NamZ domain-containing protein [Geomicrobium sp. JCM 19039]